MAAAQERDHPIRNSEGIPKGRSCTCGVDMMKTQVGREESAHVVRWVCSCCGLDERIAYRDDGSAERVED